MRTPSEIAEFIYKVTIKSHSNWYAITQAIAAAIEQERQHQAKLEERVKELETRIEVVKAAYRAESSTHSMDLEQQLAQAEARIEDLCADHFADLTKIAQLKEENKQLRDSIPTYSYNERKKADAEIVRLKAELDRMYKAFEDETLAHKAVVDEVDQLKLEVGVYREALETIKIGELDWSREELPLIEKTLALPTPDLYSAVVELVQAAEQMQKQYPEVPTETQVLNLIDALSAVEKLMGRS